MHEKVVEILRYHDLKAVATREGETVKWEMQMHYEFSETKTGREKGKGVDDGF